MNYLDDLIDKNIQVITTEGRIFTGNLVSFDQSLNVVLQECFEKVYDNSKPVQIENMGVYIIRGDNVCIISKINLDLEKKIDYTKITSEPFPLINTHLDDIN